MSGNLLARGDPWPSSGPDPDPAAVFRFSPRPNRAHCIAWRAWGPAAFAEAMRQDKPVFLVISSSWCEWCHIMDTTTLSEPSIISIVNTDYIPIRVDSDLRPDINQRYNQNGWPSVVLLSSEGEILWGGVYVPPKQMLYYLGHVRRYYSEHRQELAEQVELLHEQRTTRKLTGALPRSNLRTLCSEERSALEALPEQAASVLRDLYDPDFGGFTIHPHLKFPHPEALSLLLRLAQRDQPDALEMVRYSVEQMRDGGLWDREEGGFFRYSAAADWSMPHTEKMLDENMALLRVVLGLVEATGEQEWRDLARSQVLYINAKLWQHELGAFSGSQSADEEYYEPGLYSRASRQPPGVDSTIYTTSNARAVSTYLCAAKILDCPSLEAMALRTLDYLCEHLQHKDGSMYHYAIDGQPGLPAQLADQVWMTRALLDAYELHGRKYYLETAIALMHFACQELLDTGSGLFYDYPEDPEAVGRLAVQEQPLAENALAAECLLRMAMYSKRQSLRDTGLLVLSGCMEKYRRTGIQGAIYAWVVARAVDEKWF